MKKSYVLLLLLILVTPRIFAGPSSGWPFLIAPGTLTAHSVILLWDKPAEPANPEYQILLNGKPVASARKTNYTLSGLRPGTEYTVALNIPGNKLASGKKAPKIKFTTPEEGAVFNILDFGAKPDSVLLNTRAIQTAINTCTPGGTVYIPRGYFISGALFLKSNMTLYIEKGATLQGSFDTEDYLPVYLNRFEGWELETFASLLNGGRLDRNGGYNISNLRITGEGTLSGGGKKLGDAMIKARGPRGRGRLICLMNAREVSISGLTITEPPCWNIHYIYSDKVSVHDLNIITDGIRNGDGIDPDSSTDSYIFNCRFDTGDDCIAIKSGKNPEGFTIAKPTRNVQITDCDFVRGHGISIGSEMSGGVSDVLVRDCKAGALLNGMQIKGTRDRGGYVRNVTVMDCQLMKITIFSSLPYNNDGEPAPELPLFENFTFRNIDLSKADTREPVININGYEEEGHKLRQVSFSQLKLPAGAVVKITDAENINFDQVSTTDGSKPDYQLVRSVNILLPEK